MKNSTPVLVSWDEVKKNNLDVCYCQCPLPIMTPDGKGYCHIVKPNIDYECTECGTIMRLVKKVRKNDT